MKECIDRFPVKGDDLAAGLSDGFVGRLRLHAGTFVDLALHIIGHIIARCTIAIPVIEGIGPRGDSLRLQCIDPPCRNAFAGNDAAKIFLHRHHIHKHHALIPWGGDELHLSAIAISFHRKGRLGLDRLEINRSAELFSIDGDHLPCA